ncbi:hypothetical protein Back11_29510 [Paenibacillus baekrokdamisoli]|uniref:Uncharacterized protein n=1 Tax=Paenibacillus baekrokdamisoli TaxID=1712516 RepID=A0A3G9IT93_9BACL|nr:hypothetical protein Back11_29510 [Paenibacillus baekrokdamisoli]
MSTYRVNTVDIIILEEIVPFSVSRLRVVSIVRPFMAPEASGILRVQTLEEQLGVGDCNEW